jgi:2-dehydropantoate 2-reductase
MDSNSVAEHPRILIVGTGALATLFAWRLANAGSDITLLGSWQPGLIALRDRGARLVDGRGNERTVPVRVAQTPRECRDARQAIVLVKSWQTERAAEQLAQCLCNNGLAITLQNGLGNYEVLEKALGKERVALGSTTAGATLLGPGLVKPAGNGSIAIQSHTHLDPMVAALRLAGFQVDTIQDAQALIWGKLVINSAINPLTALLRVPNGELLKRPTARALMRALAEETAAVANAENVRLALEDPAAMVEDVARKTATNHSSMLQDIQRGAPTEIEAICGEVVRRGQRHGIPTPLNQACWQLVEALTQAAPDTTEVQGLTH